MKRWGAALILVLLACVPILLVRSSSPSLLEDSDTKFLLTVIRERQNPLGWFTGDWPLQNHFYRPISTLFFELDNALYGTDAAGYGWTNALLCVACVFALFWLVRELTESAAISTASAVLFALWISDFAYLLSYAILPLILVALVAGLLRHSLKVKYYLPAILTLSYLPYELGGVVDLRALMVQWLPGRTASVMALFGLIAMASYARYERLSARRIQGEPSPLDVPATKNTVQAGEPAKLAWIWIALSGVGLALSLGSYEQAVMLPALLFGCALMLRLRRYRVRWGWQLLFWGILVGYLLLRREFVPSEASRYQLQQFRTGPGILASLLGYLFPAGWQAYTQARAFIPDIFILMNLSIWKSVWDVIANVVAFYEARREWILALAGWAMSFVAYLPMAWLNQFDHYHFLPMALRSMLVVALLMVAYRLLVIAASPPERQAPPRPSPAPGSLPRP